MARNVHAEPFLIGHGHAARFAIVTRPATKATGGVLYVPPFAEELNKCRRMAAVTARALAGAGYVVLQLDLAGCGDSAGDFEDARWSDWLQDLTTAWEWLSRDCEGPKCLWTLRAGSLLASAWVRQAGVRAPMLMWQPVTNGQQHLVQFLRLEAAREILNAEQKKGVVTGLRSRLDSGESVEVAGYVLSSGLAASLAAARVELDDDLASRVDIVEVVHSVDAATSPAIATIAGKLSSAGVNASVHTLTGPRFWQTQEIETVTGLAEVSVEAVRGYGSGD